MGLFGGRVTPPAALRKLFGPDERLLAMADTGPAMLAATQFGLWLPTGTGWRRVDWDLVVKATWAESGLELIEGSVDAEGIVTDLPAVRLRPAEPRNLPAVLRVRVERSIGRWEQVRVPGGTGRIIGRRKAGVNGLQWTGRLDSGTPDSAEAREVLTGYLGRIAALPPEALIES